MYKGIIKFYYKLYYLIICRKKENKTSKSSLTNNIETINMSRKVIADHLLRCK